MFVNPLLFKYILFEAIEQILKQLRSMGFRNEVFKTLHDAVDRLCDTICDLTNDMVKSIACRQWIADAF